MRILYVIDSLKVGGAEMLLLDMLRGYRDQGHRLAVAYFSPGPLEGEVAALDVPASRVSRSGLADPRAVLRLVGLIRRQRPQVVHTHLWKSDLAGQLAAALAGVPVRVSTAHNVDPWRRRGALARINRLFTSRCQRVIAVSREVHDYLVETRAYQPEKLVTIENGIDLTRFDPHRQPPANLAATWGFEPDAPMIGVVGRLEPQKGHSVLLEAAVHVTRELPKARFLVVGDGHLRSELEAQRSRLGLDSRVVFTGVVHDVPATLSALDAITFPSLWEGLPVALLEAMAMEKPVVATTVGGIPEVVRDGVSGVLVPPGDPEALARGLLGVLRDPTLARRLGTQARQVVRQRYSAQTMHRRILDLYSGLMG
ncbi:MAG: glycosyltransferase [Thermoanaerobaculia bacterium]